MPALDIRNLSRNFGATSAAEDINLSIAPGELISLLGPSGSGKSTLLRMIGGFERPDEGSIQIEGHDVTDLPPEKRPTGMVFQSHALWPHMTVAGNIAFGLRLRRLDRATIEKKMSAVLAMVGLTGMENRTPTKLSGGQQQRVALARALVLEPRVLLLDEPFASLDQHLRERLRDEVHQIQRRLGITMVFVTHGQDEALAMADRIAVMRAGRLEQIGRPDEVYRQPATEFVAGFIGRASILDVEIRAGKAMLAGHQIAVPLADGPARLMIRPEDLEIIPGGKGPVAEAVRVTDFGSHLAVEIEPAPGLKLHARVSTGQAIALGAKLGFLPRRIAAYRDGRLAFFTPPCGNSSPNAAPKMVDRPLAYSA